MNPFTTTAPLRGPADLLRAGLARWSDARRRQIEIHQLTHLSKLEDRVLRDIGLSRDDVDYELHRLQRRR